MSRFLHKLEFSLIAIAFVASAIFAASGTDTLASSTDGTVDSSYKYAWTEAGGWIDFGASQGNVHITDTKFKK